MIFHRDPIRVLSELTDKQLKAIIDSGPMPAHKDIVLYYALTQANLLDMNLFSFRRYTMEGFRWIRNGNRPTINSSLTTRRIFFFALVLLDLCELSLAPLHHYVYNKALECPTGRFTLDVLKTYDPSLRKQEIELTTENRPARELSDKELQQLLFDYKELNGG